MNTTKSNLQEELATQIDQAEWKWLKPHNERGSLIIVDTMLELHQVGERLAADDMATIQGWLASRLVSKPDKEQLEAWDANPTKKFEMLVVSPFVLIKDL